MKYLKKIIALIKKGEFRTLFTLIIRGVTGRIWAIISAKKDKKIGNKDLSTYIPTKFEKLGAYSTQSTDYACLNKIFRDVPLNGDEIFVDVGCGEGRVLTYLYLKGFKGKIIGVELDPEVAKTASERTAECSNINVVCENILESFELLENASVYYLFNPFNKDILSKFIEKIEEYATVPARLYYCNDLYKSVFVGRDKWTVVGKGTVKRLHAPSMNYSVYLFTP